MPEVFSAGIELKINNTIIPACCFTPDMGNKPEKKDVSSFDQKKFKKKADGLIDIDSLKFEFWDQTTNYNTAHSSESAASNSYSLTYPDGSKYTWTGTHKAYKLSASPGDYLKFAIECTPDGDINESPGTAAPPSSSE